ncbi:Ig-like domain repeat protein, partial [Escherichia coli]|nr:Ig-like domain repeat protein [Escherichia coli]
GSATPGLTVLLTVGGQTYSVEANDQGIWRLELTTDLTEGLNSIEAKVTDSSNGLTSTANSSVFIDTGVPVVDVSLEDIRDTGIKGDFITQNRWPVFVGKSEPNCTVTFRLGETTVSVKADNQGNWRVEWPNQMAANSTNNFTITIEDVAGNSTQDNVTLVVDNQAPNLQFIGFTDETDLGNKDQIWTSHLTPTLTGTAEPGVRIEIKNGSSTWSTTADNNGNWEWTIPEGFVSDNGRQQDYTFHVIAIDAAGNKTQQSQQLHFHKKHNFTATSGLTPETDSDQKGDMITTNARPSFQGNINIDGGGSILGGELLINGKTYPVTIHRSGNSWSWSCALTSE